MRGHRAFLLVLLFLSLYLSYKILIPFSHAIILSIFIASIFYPLKPRLEACFMHHKNLMALAAVLGITVLIIIPVLFFTVALVNQGIDTFNAINQWIGAGNLQKLMESDWIRSYSAWMSREMTYFGLTEVDLQGQIMKFSKNIGQFILGQGAAMVKNTANGAFQFIIMMFILFYLIRDGEEILMKIKELSPLREDQEDRIIQKVKETARVSLMGNFVTVLCQALAGGIGLAIVGLPALFWGTLMGFASLIPVVGTALIWVPASGYLMFIGNWKQAVFLLLWCILIVGSIDNFLRPFLMKGKGTMSPFFIFLAVAGGIKWFGILGILYGPLILALTRVVLYIYQVEYQSALNHRNTLNHPET